MNKFNGVIALVSGVVTAVYCIIGNTHMMCYFGVLTIINIQFMYGGGK